MTSHTTPETPILGWASFFVGSLALVSAFAIFWAGPFAPQQAASVSLGELAAEIAKSAARSAVGVDQPAPVAIARDVDDYLKIAVAVLGGFAIVLAAGGLVRREPWRAGTAGLMLGASAIAFQLFTFMVMAIIGALLICAIIYSLGDTFGSIFGG